MDEIIYIEGEFKSIMDQYGQMEAEYNDITKPRRVQQNRKKYKFPEGCRMYNKVNGINAATHLKNKVIMICNICNTQTDKQHYIQHQNSKKCKNYKCITFNKISEIIEI